MCGIAGVMQIDADPHATMSVCAMMRRQRHRGPDGEAIQSTPSGRAVLAHSRLSVFDPSDRGRQPMCIADGRYTITYNGAIYNFRDLRRGLESDGIRFVSDTDTEVILRLYERDGERCVHRLRGMFAFAIWDEHERTGFLARDVFGIKPLYYATPAGRLLFASEVRAMVASGLIATDLDAVALEGYFHRGSVAEPATLLRSVRMLPAGGAGFWKNGQLTIKKALTPPWDVASASDGDSVAAARDALLDSVARHCASDVPVAVFLSGGIDSAAIVALAAQARVPDLRAFSLALPGSARDEGKTAARTARAFGVQHDILDVDASVARASLADYLRALDQPTIDGLNTFMTARFARDRGVRVVLTGLGADEWFGGYPSFWRVPSLNRLHRAAAAMPFGASAGVDVARRSASPRARRVADLFEQPPSLEAAYRTFRGVFTRAEGRRLVRHFAEPHPGDEPELTAVTAATPAETISVLELTNYVRNQLLRDGDVMAMASGVELRTPFLDRDLGAVLWSIPARTRIQRGKRLLRQAVPELPFWTWSGKKQCFQLPFDEWMQDEWRDVFGSVRPCTAVPMQNWYRTWCVAALRSALDNLHEAAGEAAVR